MSINFGHYHRATVWVSNDCVSTVFPLNRCTCTLNTALGQSGKRGVQGCNLESDDRIGPARNMDFTVSSVNAES
jgi:hypothetical protein